MSMLFPEFEPVLLISIKKEHLEKIFKKEKLYELRKVLPKTAFSHIFFYQTGSGGIVGRCRVDRIIEGSPSKVWSIVGDASTSKERFNAYFANKSRAYAIGLSDPVIFNTPLPPKILKEYIPTFSVPQSYLLIGHDHPLYKILQQTETPQQAPTTFLRSPTTAEIDQFCQLVEQEIGPRYPDTGREYSNFIREIHSTHSDPHGFLTIGKEINAISHSDGTLLGFTVLTFKRGRAIKTGPTMLFSKFRGKGFGISVRSAIEDRAMSLGASKVYCTCPAEDKPILFHLLKCGYKIEGHLEKHYSSVSNEIVFAKELCDSQPQIPSHLIRESTSGKVATIISKPTGFSQALKELLKFSSLDIPINSCRRIISEFSIEKLSYNLKPRRAIWLTAKGRPIGVALIAFKRGGSARAVLGIKTAHSPSIDRLISSCIELAVDQERRKLYFLHPILDSKVVQRLMIQGFFCEGVLRGAYVSGNDIGVYSKILS